MASLKVVVDAQVLASGFVGKRGGAADELVRLNRKGVFDLVLTVTLVSEVETTLRALGAAESIVADLLAMLCRDASVFVAIRHQVLGCRDANDDHIIEAALVGNAHVIVTRDRDLLELPTQVENLLRQRRILVLTDVQFLEFARRKMFSPLTAMLSISIDDIAEHEPAGSCPLCGHGFHWDIPCFEIWADQKGEPVECDCFAVAVTA